MRVLVACEYSGRVRDAFRALGHDAWSCDLLPSQASNLHHFQGDVRTILERGSIGPWDLMVAHPPCTIPTRAGARWWKGREAEQQEALDFVQLLMDAPIERIAIENPPGAIGTRIRPADQYVQPWMFGHPETKATGLWLKNLPKLTPTNDVHAHMLTLPMKERSRVHYAAPGPDRWMERSTTLEGIARAMAAQWSSFTPSQTELQLETRP
jgi:hypothetical protein